MLILTPNRRLAAFSTRLYDQENLASDKVCWESAQIYPFATWLQQLWNGKPIISKTQQQFLLEQIIQNSQVGVDLLRVGPTAKNVLQAWDFLCGWQISLSRLESYAKFSPNTEVFCLWIEEYLAWLKQNDYVDFHLMVQDLRQQLPDLKTILPAEILLRGMHNLSPRDNAFMQDLVTCGIKITHDSLTRAGAENILTSFSDSNTEIQAAANWALHNLQQQQPDQIIGIVVPELETKRQQVANVFNALIPPELLNISAPLSLDQYPLINMALLLLQMAKPKINYSDFSIVLRSPFIHAANLEQNNRACIDRELREVVEAKLTWDSILKLLAPMQTELKSIISDFSSIIDDSNGYHDTEYWAEYFARLLKLWGWPGQRGLTAQESDLYSCWHEMIDEYVKLSIIIKEHNFSQALHLLQNLAAQTPFLPAETGVSKVHVLGLLEADGLFFDQLWVTGMSINTWPPEANPNPFIPLEIQKQFDLPKSSPQRELKVAQNLTANLQRGAEHRVIFSYPQFIDDYKSQVSNLLHDLEEQQIPGVQPKKILQDEELELFFDAHAKPILVADSNGGTKVLKLQAQCPFKANAEMRLNAIQLVQPELVLNKAQRGNIIHAVLEDFWRECKTQQQLISWFPEAVREKLTEIISKVLKKWRIDYPNILTDEYLSLEEHALLNITMRWLEYETKRDWFRVQCLEEKRNLSIGPLNISTRIDRIDELIDGSTVIIDYKTGDNNVSDWNSEPILEPQLPIYALTEQQSLSGVYYASIKLDDMRMKGINQDKVDLTQKISEWLEILTSTARDFADGNARVNPYSAQICTNCNLQGFCRINDC